ncbi:MAG TPA: YbhB/YbcL family Raf kinase inhibitor-like protein [Caulobacteraceae bacterium]|nr:YbhB/YbcL family Raf kinase inhibitor-like protein [Caulobacteraceae bacterium]
MRARLALTAFLLVLAACGRASSQPEASMAQHDPPRSPEALSLGRITPREPGAVLELLSTAVDPDGKIERRYAAYGDNLSPPLHWTPVKGARAYAIIVEDPDAPMERPYVHWLIWNIPGDVDWLPEGLPQRDHLVTPQGAIQGRNDTGDHGYFGPRPPAGTGVHHYHFQIFALDEPLTLPSSASLRALVDAMKGHVLADGELVGTYAAPQ